MSATKRFFDEVQDREAREGQPGPKNVTTDTLDTKLRAMFPVFWELNGAGMAGTVKIGEVLGYRYATTGQYAARLVYYRTPGEYHYGDYESVTAAVEAEFYRQLSEIAGQSH